MVLNSFVEKFWSYSLRKFTYFKSRLWTRDTCHVGSVPGERSFAVDNYGHLNYLQQKIFHLGPSVSMWHMSGVHKCDLKLVNFISE